MGLDGAIFNSVTLTIKNSTFLHNSATGFPVGAGGIHNLGTLTDDNSRFDSNCSADTASAISNEGTVTVSRSTFSDNICDAGGMGAIYSNGTLTVTLNDKLVNSAESLDPAAGPIGIQAEGAEMEFRKLDLVPIE